MTSLTPTRAPEEALGNVNTWYGETGLGKKRELVSILTNVQKKPTQAVIDYSASLYKRLSEVLENTKSSTLGIITKEDPKINYSFDHIVCMKILDGQNGQMIDINNKISENKPMEIEIVFDDGHIVVGTIFMKHYNDLCLRVDSSKFVNLVNVNAFGKLDENDEKKMGKMIPCTMLCNTKRIFTVKEINKLYKTVKVWVIDNDSKIKGKKKQIEKIVPLDYIEEDITEINNVISNSMIGNFQMPR